jgi:hypothetical protein
MGISFPRAKSSAQRAQFVHVGEKGHPLPSLSFLGGDEVSQGIRFQTIDQGSDPFGDFPADRFLKTADAGVL